MYCSKCQIVFDETDRCPVCKNKKIRQPLPDDICFLTEVDSIWSSMLEDVLKQNGIPAYTNSTIGAGMAAIFGPMCERIRFYVLYEQLPKAKEIAEELFPSGDAGEPLSESQDDDEYEDDEELEEEEEEEEE